MSYTALNIARYIVNYANKKNMSISNLKLQKILYYVQGKFLANDRMLFDDDIVNWKYGPVIVDVYNNFRIYGSEEIPPQKYYYEVEKIDGCWATTKKEFRNESISISDRHKIDDIIAKYIKKSSFELVRDTHNEAPWLNTSTNEIITKEALSIFFKGVKN